MVLAPFAEVKQAAVYRLTVDYRNRNAVLEISARMREADELRAAIAALRRASVADSLAIAGLRDHGDLLLARVEKADKKVKRRGRVIAILVPVTIGAVVAGILR